MTAKQAPSIARVMFGQRGSSGVTASLRHTSGPLIVGERVVVFEVDEETIWGWATVLSFDKDTHVAEVEVEWSTLTTMQPPHAGETALAPTAQAARASVSQRVRELASA